VSLAEAKESGDYRKFGADLVAALAAGIGIGAFTGSPYAGALAFTIVLNFEIGSWIGDKLEQLQQHPVMKELRAFLGTGPTAEGEVLLRYAQGERFSLAGPRDVYRSCPGSRPTRAYHAMVPKHGAGAAVGPR